MPTAHVAVDDRRADEVEPSFLEVLAESVRQIGTGPEVGRRARVVDDGRVVYPRPEVLSERPVLGAHREERLRVAHRRFHLEPISHDAGIGEQRGQLGFVVARDSLRIEVVEGAPVVGPLVEDGRPRQPGLRAFEHEHLEQMRVVVRRLPPFVVVVRAHQVGALGPRAPLPGGHAVIRAGRARSRAARTSIPCRSR
jgi:hypothetical protein